MAVWTSILFKSLFSGLDLAAEHYHPEKLRCLDVLQQSKGVALSSIADNIRNLIVPNINTKTLPIFDLGAASAHILNANNAIQEDRISTKKIVKAGDVLVSRLRYYLQQVALVPDKVAEAYVSTEFIVLRSSYDINIAFIVPFILSNPIQTILAWSQDGNEHPRFSENLLLKLKIPDSVLRITEQINNILAEATDKATEAQKKILEAEYALNFALGLDRVDLAPRLFYENKFSQAAEAGRLDAEYFSPRMQNVIETLSRDGLTIADVAPQKKRHFKPIPGQSFKYIEIADIGGSGIAESKTIAGEEAPSRATWIVKAGDIITTTVRPIRRLSAIITPEQEGYVCSSGFAVLRPREIEPELLLAYLRLPLVAELLDLHTTASMYPAISTTALLRLPISLPEEADRREIDAKVRKSFASNKESRRLLETAKRAVEIAIEEGEAAARKFLDN